MNLIGLNAKKATLEKINTKIKNKVLKRYASLLNKEKYSIIRANIKDIDFAQIKRNKEVVACMMIGYPKVEYKRTAPRKTPDICWK